MPKYSKIPVVIEAFQMTQEARQNNTDWPDWLNQAWQKPIMEQGAVYPANSSNSDGTDLLKVRTLEGPLIVSWDDYIIKGVKGELYPCKPDIFEMTYNKVEE